MTLNIDYPNPVLSPERDDYNENCSFDVSFNEEGVTVDDDYILIPAICDIHCDGLLKLISEKKAAIVVLISSSASFYRKTYEFASSQLTEIIKIPKFDVRKSIEFCGYVLVKEDMNSFRCDGEFNDLYFKNMSFAVKKADVLAQGLTRTIPIDDSELEKPISSIFRIKKNLHSDAEVESNFDEDEKIIIYLSERLNQLYYDMKDFNNGSLHRYLNGIISYPVLIEGIAKICDYYRGGTDYSEKRWFKTIEHKLSGMGIVLKDVYEDCSYTEIADKLLGGISYDGLLSVKNTIDNEVNNGEYINTGGVD